MPRQWRSEVEHAQTLSKHKGFTHTTTGATAEDVVLIAGNMEEGVKVSFIVESGAAYVEFDGTATTSSMLIPENEGYADSGVSIVTKISILRVSANARIRGIIWGF